MKNAVVKLINNLNFVAIITWRKLVSGIFSSCLKNQQLKGKNQYLLHTRPVIGVITKIREFFNKFSISF